MGGGLLLLSVETFRGKKTFMKILLEMLRFGIYSWWFNKLLHSSYLDSDIMAAACSKSCDWWSVL